MADILIDSVYFERKELKLGTGHTVQKKVENIHYYIKEKSNGELDVEMLNPAGKRTGMVVDVIDKETFLKRFVSCFEHECHFFPKLSPEESKVKAKQHLENGERLKEQNEMKQAELEYGNAIKFDESSARASYGLAKIFIETGKVDKGKDLLRKLTRLEGVFEKENKHLFNEIGIDLRKQELFSEAFDYYNKAISIDSQDTTLYYNLARLHKENNKYQDAMAAIKKALEIKPDFKEGRELHVWLQAKL